MGSAYDDVLLRGLLQGCQSDEEDAYRQRYWMCDNFAFEPTPCQICIGLLVSSVWCVFII